MSSTSYRYCVLGFTLIELLVSMSIFAMLAVIIIANYPESEMRLKLAEINQNVSLAFREAQIRGSAIDSKKSSVGGYGIYISSAAKNKVVLFNDLVATLGPNGIYIGDGLYDPSTETNTIISLPSRFSIAKLCILGSNGSYSCDSANVPAIVDLTVTFIRPDPMPKIYINDDKTVSYSAACVEIQSIKAPLPGHVRSIQILNSGLIRTVAGPC